MATSSTGSGVRITRGTLSDGREILWFDDISKTDRTQCVDGRGLPPTHTFSEMRRDPLTGDWAVYAAHRQNRTFLPPANENPLAPTIPGQLPTEIPAQDYDVVVFENRFPSLSTHMEIPDDFPNYVDAAQLVPRKPAVSRCEVVCFTSTSDGSFRDLPLRRIRTLVDVWAHRTEELSRIPEVKAVFPFENRGQDIGVTLQHPHGQIYSYPYLPPRTAAIVDQARAYEQTNGANLFDALIASEITEGTRVLSDTEHFLVFVPAAAKWPMEIMVMAKDQVPDFPSLSMKQRDELARILSELYPAVDRFFDGIENTPYISAWNQAPVDEDLQAYGRLHLQLFSLMRSPGRMKYLAGSESAMGAWISDTTPEIIAQRLREVW